MKLIESKLVTQGQYNVLTFYWRTDLLNPIASVVLCHEELEDLRRTVGVNPPYVEGRLYDAMGVPDGSNC